MANTITFANRTLTDADIYGGISYTADLNTGDELSIGNTASASVQFSTYVQLPLYTKDSTNGTFTWTQDGTPRGRYYITEVTKEQSMYTITAYDAMILLEPKISELSLTFPLTVSAAASAVATYIGCTVAGTILNGSLSVASLDAELTIRQLLSYVAEASGCSVKIDGSDHLTFMYYADSGITVTASDYITLEVADYTCAKIDNVTIFNMLGEIQASAGSGYNSLFIGQNPFLEEATNTNATNILNAVKDLQYAPVKCEMFEENGIEVGTTVTFGSTVSLVMHLESSESGAMVSSVGNDNRGGYNKSLLVVVNETAAIAADAQSLASAASNILSDMQAAATAAGTTLNGIYADAEAAKTTLAGMEAAAEAAGTTLTAIYQTAADAAQAASDAQDSADEAARQSSIANLYANTALDQLGIVQDVVGVLDLLSTNANYQLTSDTEVVPGKWYFTRSGTAPDYVYTVVTNPVTADIGTYYEIVSIDEAVESYVTSRLAVTSDGLWIQDPNMATKILLSSTDGVVLYGPNGTIIGKYGATAQIGDAASFHIEMDGTELGFYQADRKVAYISNQQLYITQSVVLQQMDLGTTVNDGGLGQWSWKVHPNGETPSRNNLNLKWIG